MTIEEHLAAVLEALGYTDDPEAQGTPERVAEVLRTFAPGQVPPPIDTFPSHGFDPVVLRDLPFHSMCVHHLLPFHGTCDIAYMPVDRIAGLGAFPRALRHFARQPQLQERLGAQLAEHLHAALGAPVVVRIRARQMCMEMRGIESPGLVETVTTRGANAERVRGLVLGHGAA
jgi:GTP cyclohydrolase I